MKVIRVIALSLLAWAGAAAASQQAPLDPKLQFEELVSGLTNPTTMAFIGPDDILLLQKDDGRVLRVLGGVLQPGEVLDVDVHYFSEQGLLGIATDPDFINNRYVYLYYTQSPTPGSDINPPNAVTQPLGNKVYRYTWDGAALVDPRLILDLPTGNGPHDAGILAFGPDDKLYVMVGDTGKNGKLQNNSSGADPEDAGVILRVNVDGSGPPDNPFYDPTDLSNPVNRYYAYGIRNSFGMGFDPVSGDLWETENGPQSYDEVNRVEPGMNGGHSKIWGPDDRDPEDVSDLWALAGSTYSDPEFSWFVCPAITTVAFVETPKLGCDYKDDLLIGSYGCRVIYRFDLDPSRKSLVLTNPAAQDLVADNLDSRCDQEQAELLFAVGPQFNSDSTSDIKTGPDGLLYLVSYSHGTLRRLAPIPGAFTDVDADQVDDACDCNTADATAYGIPAEVPRLRLSGGLTVKLGWNPQNAEAGSGTTYTVVSGSLSALSDDGGFDSACTLGAGLGDAALEDTRNPNFGDGLYYLVRAENSCASGGFGEGSSGPGPREAIDAVLPDPCP